MQNHSSVWVINIVHTVNVRLQTCMSKTRLGSFVLLWSFLCFLWPTFNNATEQIQLQYTTIQKFRVNVIFKEINTFIKQGHIKLIKSDSS